MFNLHIRFKKFTSQAKKVKNTKKLELNLPYIAILQALKYKYSLSIEHVRNMVFYLQTQKNLRVRATRSVYATILKVFVSHLSTRVNRMKYFFSFFLLLLKQPCMFYRPELTVRRSIKKKTRPHAWYFLYFIPYIVIKLCTIYVI